MNTLPKMTGDIAGPTGTRAGSDEETPTKTDKVEQGHGDHGAASVEASLLPADARNDERIPQLAEVRQAVFRVLRYAVAQTNAQIDETLIKTTVAVLHKDPETLTPEEEALLWKNYNMLSMLVFPATNESIRIAEQIDEDQRNRAGQVFPTKRLPAALECRKQLRRVVFWLVGILLFFIVLQSYVILLTDVLRGVEQHNTALNSLEQQLKEIKTVKPDIEEDNPNLTDIEGKRANLDAKVIASFDMLIRLSLPWRWLYTNPQKQEHPLIKATASEIPGTTGQTNSKKAENPSVEKQHYQRIAVEQAARSVLQMLNYYLLPLVLGLLGAVAFIVRRLLSSLASTSYTLNSGRRYAMRLALGALLGVISGIFLAPEQTQLQPFNLPLVVFAFLMGYSVEFAFSVFDALIERGRQAFSSNEARPGAQAKDGK